MNFFENIERRNSYYEDCLELNPLVVKDLIDVPKNKYLLVGGLLSEFKTKSSKDLAKLNLGLNDFISITINNEFNLDFINKSGTYIISGKRINLLDGFPDNNLENIKAQLIVFNNSNEISQILFLNNSGILLYKRNGNILKDGSIIWENWDTNLIKNNSITLDKLSLDVAEKINSTAVKNITLNENGDKFIITFLDNTSKEIETVDPKTLVAINNELDNLDEKIKNITDDYLKNSDKKELVDRITNEIGNIDLSNYVTKNEFNSKIFIGTKTEYNIAYTNNSIAVGALVIILDEPESSTDTMSLLGTAVLGKMILGKS